MHCQAYSMSWILPTRLPNPLMYINASSFLARECQGEWVIDILLPSNFCRHVEELQSREFSNPNAYYPSQEVKCSEFKMDKWKWNIPATSIHSRWNCTCKAIWELCRYLHAEMYVGMSSLSIIPHLELNWIASLIQTWLECGF